MAETVHLYAQFKAQPGNEAFQAYPGAVGLVGAVRKAHPEGVGLILMGSTSNPGFKLISDSKGTVAVLIGLLLPAVQKLATTRSSDVQLLSGALAPSGQLGILMGDGSVKPPFGAGPLKGREGWMEILHKAAGFTSAEGRSMSFEL